MLSFAILLLVLALVAGINVHYGLFKLRSIDDLEPLARDAHARSISIVVAARNEERHIVEATRSLLALDYPDYEVLVVNDRSTDRTGELLRRLASENPLLKVVEIAELPKGWLGKNHALHVGATHTRGELLLFTDADVVFRADALRRAVAYFDLHGLDHLALFIKIWSRSFWATQFISFFAFNFLSFLQPWEARNPRSRRYVGIGAFNLIHRRAYEAIGGHSKLALRPDDDIKLGKVLKLAGFRQDCALSPNTVSVEWYASLQECMVGLEKNIFAGMDYSLTMAFFGTMMMVTIYSLPLPLSLIAEGTPRFLLVLSWAGLTLAVCGAARRIGARWFDGLLYPLGALMMSFLVARNVAKNIREGGISWRDTFYSLEDLKKNRV